MFVPLLLRRQALRIFPPLIRNSFIPVQRRSLHSVPPLTRSGNDIPGLFTADAFKLAWTDYQSSLIEKLNQLTAGVHYQHPKTRFTKGFHGIDKHDVADKEFGNNTVVEIAIMTARQADLAAVFNYASQAHNNHFFFESLTSEETIMPETFLGYIPDTFTSPLAMKTEFLATAEAMFGCGWVWLVFDHAKRLRILCTYNAGTPYGEAYRRQNTDVNTGETLGATNYTSQTRSAGRGHGSQVILPLLNVNCWEHAWITDYGVLGKKEYLERWWNRVNWSVVANRLGSTLSSTLVSARQPYTF